MEPRGHDSGSDAPPNHLAAQDSVEPFRPENALRGYGRGRARPPLQREARDPGVGRVAPGTLWDDTGVSGGSATRSSDGARQLISAPSLTFPPDRGDHLDDGLLDPDDSLERNRPRPPLYEGVGGQFRNNGAQCGARSGRETEHYRAAWMPAGRRDGSGVVETEWAGLAGMCPRLLAM
jgi:hypothetical protein